MQTSVQSNSILPHIGGSNNRKSSKEGVDNDGASTVERIKDS